MVQENSCLGFTPPPPPPTNCCKMHGKMAVFCAHWRQQGGGAGGQWGTGKTLLLCVCIVLLGAHAGNQQGQHTRGKLDAGPWGSMHRHTRPQAGCGYATSKRDRHGYVQPGCASAAHSTTWVTCAWGTKQCRLLPIPQGAHLGCPTLIKDAGGACVCGAVCQCQCSLPLANPGGWLPRYSPPCDREGRVGGGHFWPPLLLCPQNSGISLQKMVAFAATCFK